MESAHGLGRVQRRLRHCDGTHTYESIMNITHSLVNTVINKLINKEIHGVFKIGQKIISKI